MLILETRIAEKLRIAESQARQSTERYDWDTLADEVEARLEEPTSHGLYKYHLEG